MKEKWCLDCGVELSIRNKGDIAWHRCVDCFMKLDADYLEAYHDWLDRLALDMEEPDTSEKEVGCIEDLGMERTDRDISQMGPEEFISHDTMTEIKKQLILDREEKNDK